jgi:ATP-dependent Clp protease adapter protein ClpS
MKNSGNEAKKYLKTKDITFSDAAICAHFKREFAQIEHQKAQKTAHSAQMKSGFPGG